MADEKKEFTQIDANKIAISLNVMFNNAVMYGGVHPTTKQNSSNFYDTLKPIISIHSEITLMRTGDSLYIEKFCINDRMNIPRVIAAFQRSGIESITITNGVSVSDLQQFIAIYSDLNIPTVDNKNSALSSARIKHIKFNYIFYQKVTKDETIVNSTHFENVSSLLPSATEKTNIESSPFIDNLSYTPGSNSGADEFVNQVGDLLSFKNIFESSNDNNQADSNSVVNGNDFVEELRKVNRKVNTANLSSMSADEMVESVLNATTELKQGLSLQKEMGKIIKEEDLVISEIDRITYQTVVDLMCEEYRSGKISVKRLSRMIRKILPDIKELKKIMPMLKDGLMSEGMGFTDFLQLTKELNRELSENEASIALAKGADDLGLSVDDLVDAMGDDPTEAARLIVLAAEIKQSGATDEYALSKLLTDYIEAASSDMAINNNVDNVEGADGEAVSKMITELEDGILNKLQGQGVDSEVVKDVKNELANRFPKTVNKFKTDMIVNAISSGGQLSSNQMKGLFGEKLPDKVELDKLQGNISEALSARGFSKGAADDFFNEITGKFKSPVNRIILPKSVISTNNTKFFLQRYIKEYSRYQNPFSALNISAKLVIEIDGARPATIDDRAYILPALCDELKSQLRDLDIIGFVGDPEVDPIFVIMPMTDYEGTKIVLDRLRETLPKLQISFKKDTATVRFVITALQYSKVVSPDSKSFIKQIINKHNTMLAH